MVRTLPTCGLVVALARRLLSRLRMRARPVFKHVTLFVTRSVRGQQFRLRPSPETNRIVLYIVANLARSYGMQIHAVCVMSNHWHVVLHDPCGNIVDFTRDCHSLITRHINLTYDDAESMWASAQTSHVSLADAHDVIDKIAYTMANPVAARLVKYGRSWPGVRRAWPAKPRVIKRPPGLFRAEQDGGTWPESVVFELHRPRGYDDLSDEDLAALIAERIETREDSERAEAAANGETFLGRAAVLRQSRYARPAKRRDKWGISPRVAAKNKWSRIERLNADRAWLADYEDKRDRWRAGDREVVFPHGSYKMRVHHGVAVAPPPT